MNLDQDVNLEQDTQVDETKTSEQPTQPEMVDLDSLDKFRYGGQEWSKSDFQNAILRQADYTRKTQEIAEERKYWSNLEYDLDKIKQNPYLAEEFRKVYPEKFHNFLKHFVPNDFQANARQQTQMDPQLKNELAEIKAFRQEMFESKVQANEEQLSAIASKMSDKYPLANEEIVLNRAHAMLDKASQDGRKVVLTEKIWDDLWKRSHEDNQGRYNKYYSNNVKMQTNANLRGRDSGRGGAIPGQAPKQPRTIKEAAELARQELESA